MWSPRDSRGLWSFDTPRGFDRRGMRGGGKILTFSHLIPTPIPTFFPTPSPLNPGGDGD